MYKSKVRHCHKKIRKNVSIKTISQDSRRVALELYLGDTLLVKFVESKKITDTNAKTTSNEKSCFINYLQ